MVKSKDIVQITSLCKDIEFIKAEVVEIKQRLDGNYVTKDEFDPVRKVVYGLVALILTAVVGALIGLVITR